MVKWKFCDKVNFIWNDDKFKIMLEYNGKVVYFWNIIADLRNVYTDTIEQCLLDNDIQQIELSSEADDRLFQSFCMGNENLILELIDREHTFHPMGIH